MARTPRPPDQQGSAAAQRVYRVVFHNQGSIYEVFARQVAQGALYGFVEVEELLFQEHSQVVIDPNEDRLRHEFKGVRRFYVPLHAVVRIDEVEREEAGAPRISAADGSGAGSGTARVTPFPMPFLPPRGPGRS